MKIIKYVLLLILRAGSTGGAINVTLQTVTDRILTTRKKPLKQTEIEKSIEFCERAN